MVSPERRKGAGARKIFFEVVGVPAPQGSKTAYTVAGRTVLVEGKTGQRERHKTWREGVAQACRVWLATNPEPFAPLDEPLSIEVEFRFPLPKSDQYRTFHVGPPDIDKLLRSTFDALVFGGMIRDDAIIATATGRKLYARGVRPPGATIEIWPHGHTEELLRAALKDQARLDRQSARGPAA